MKKINSLEIVIPQRRSQEEIINEVIEYNKDETGEIVHKNMTRKQLKAYLISSQKEEYFWERSEGVLNHCVYKSYKSFQKYLDISSLNKISDFSKMSKHFKNVSYSILHGEPIGNGMMDIFLVYLMFKNGYIEENEGKKYLLIHMAIGKSTMESHLIKNKYLEKNIKEKKEFLSILISDFKKNYKNNLKTIRYNQRKTSCPFTISKHKKDYIDIMWDFFEVEFHSKIKEKFEEEL